MTSRRCTRILRRDSRAGRPCHSIELHHWPAY